jgi:hypothetical protein
MADGLGSIYFEDLNIEVIYIALKKKKMQGALGIGDNLLPMDHCPSQLG